MEVREQLVNLMLTSFGIDLYPKADGRVEIPKYVVIKSGWNSLDMVYMSSDMCGNLYISADSDLIENEVSVAVAISGGRLRIPAGFLKKVNLHNKNLVATYDADSTLCLKADNSENEEALTLFLEELDDLQAAKLLDMLTGGKSLRSDNDIPNMELIRVSANQKALPEAKMFLLEGDETRSFVFRPVGNPYKFKFCWINKVPKLVRSDVKNNALTLYIIPGVNRVKKDENLSGFLLIDQTTFEKICYIVKKKNESTAIGKDLIFMFSPKVKIGSFKVFENPHVSLDPKIVEEAKMVCANPEQFLSNNFGLFESGECDHPPTTITVNTIGNINKSKH